METFLKFIFILLIAFYVLRLALRYVFPWLLKRFVRKQQKRYENPSGFTNKSYGETEKGKVKIRKTTKKKSKKDNGLGEYVDFEEIE